MLQVIEASLSKDETDRVYMRGVTKIMNQPEFRDVEKVKDILELLEQNDQLVRLFGPPTEGLQIRIGQENNLDAMKQCSIVTTSYYMDGKPVGMIGILGPTRMEYDKVIAVLDYLAQGLSRMLTDEFDKK
jgi:heat-inducible transcriptional repressor